jgi:4-amino-4-deoxy-L-arabinose transferase-like glycosyltransferase
MLLFSPSLMKPATPAIVTAAAAQPMPRWWLWLLALAYVLPGFWGREPWKNADVTAFGVMKAMAHGQTPWLNPAVLGQPLESPALLPYWLGALTIQGLPFDASVSVRVLFTVVLALTLLFTWRAVFKFAVAPAAQPVVFAFGGQASPVDYARAIADASVLGLIACLGLAQLAHETTPDALELMGMALTLSGLAELGPGRQQRLTRGGLLWTTGLLVMGLSGGAHASLVLALGTLGGLVLTQAAPATQLLRLLPGLLLVLALWLWPPSGAHTAALPVPGGLAQIWGLPKLVLWFSWPVWPLALWSLWRWRRHLRAHHLSQPLMVVLVVLALTLWEGHSDRRLLTALPALAGLAAFSLPTLRRSVAALIDWFSVLFFSLGAGIVWVVWMAMMTGIPARPAANVARLAPGFVPTFHAWALTAALAATAGWLVVVHWRMGRHPPFVWKSLVLPATGGVLCWLLLMTLWLPLLDHARSYGPLARRLADMLPANACVWADGLSQAQASGLLYQGGIDLRAMEDPEAAQACAYRIGAPTTAPAGELPPPPAGWRFKARLSRLTDNKETLLLYERSP